jgi:hypothetical protein
VAAAEDFDLAHLTREHAFLRHPLGGRYSNRRRGELSRKRTSVGPSVSIARVQTFAAIVASSMSRSSARSPSHKMPVLGVIALKAAATAAGGFRRARSIQPASRGRLPAYSILTWMPTMGTGLKPVSHTRADRGDLLAVRGAGHHVSSSSL